MFIDLDGTLAGESVWKSISWNYWRLFRTGLKFQIPEDLNWIMLTARPRIDLPVIKMVCRYYNLNPEGIITFPTLFYDRFFDETIMLAGWKRSTMLKFYEEDTTLIYVDNDPNVLFHIEPHPSLILCNTEDFKRLQEEQ